MPRGRKSQRAKRKANREEILELKRNRILDPTPYVAILNMITKGKYLRLGKGFIVRHKIASIKEVAV